MIRGRLPLNDVPPVLMAATCVVPLIGDVCGIACCVLQEVNEARYAQRLVASQGLVASQVLSVDWLVLEAPLALDIGLCLRG